MATENIIWYNKAAETFNEALPMGNGRIGAMVYGRPINEVLSLNEDSIWSGGLRNRNNPNAFEGMQEVRRLIDEENLKQAETVVFQKMQGICSESRSYMPLGNLFIHMANTGKVKDYKRELDLKNAIATIFYNVDDVSYVRQVFVSNPDNVLVVHIESDKPGSVSFTANIDGRSGFYDDDRPVEKNIIMYTGGSGGRNGINFASYLTVKATGGRATTKGATLYVEGADEATLLLSVSTSFYTEDYMESALTDLKLASECSYSEIMFRHVGDYKSLFDRVRFDLDESSKDFTELPTDERLEKLHGEEFNDNEVIREIFDPGIQTLLYNYARYLMISASRPGTQPMNMQGIWNEDILPKWGSRYIINVNAEMNYWGAESANLSECHLPLFDLIERIRKNGAVTASEMYHCRGFVCHHNTDIWGDSAPQDEWKSATMWPMGAAWLCLHIFEHYRYTDDKEFLRKKYGTLKECALFFVDFMIEDEKGRLITSPTVSPENSYKTKSGAVGSICKGAEMDLEIITALFKDICEACDILDIDREFQRVIKNCLEKIPPIKIGKYGQIQEWTEDYDEVDVGHRHVSQLFGLFPENLISMIKTPKLADAARVTLIRRLIYEDGHFGWSYAWNMNMWARLHDGEMAYENMQKLFLYSLGKNMLNTYPPFFQIDGNMGTLSAFDEMLMQSQNDEIELLPALPKRWANGSITGLKARGNFEVSIYWKSGKLEHAEILSVKGNTVKIRVNQTVSVVSESPVDTRFENGLVIFETKPNERYIING